MAEEKTEPTEIEVLQNSVKQMQSEISTIHSKLAEKNEQIEVLSVANTDLINIDMKAISQDIRDAEVRLNSVATRKHWEVLGELKKYKGPEMAHITLEQYYSDAGKQCQMTIPVLNQIKLNMEKISEKLKYIAEAQDATN